MEKVLNKPRNQLVSFIQGLKIVLRVAIQRVENFFQTLIHAAREGHMYAHLREMASSLLAKITLRGM